MGALREYESEEWLFDNTTTVLTRAGQAGIRSLDPCEYGNDRSACTHIYVRRHRAVGPIPSINSSTSSYSPRRKTVRSIRHHIRTFQLRTMSILSSLQRFQCSSRMPMVNRDLPLGPHLEVL